MTDTTIDFITTLYAKQSTYKPQSTLVYFEYVRAAKCNQNQNDIQILYGENYHWICTFYKANDGKIYVYDSIYRRQLTGKQKEVLQRFYPFIPKDNFDNYVVFVPPKLRQGDGVSCGVFALFYMKLLMDGSSPENSVGNISRHIYENNSALAKHLRIDLKRLVLSRFI